MSFFVPLASFSLVDWKIYIYIWAGTITVGGVVGILGIALRQIGLELTAITLLLTGYVAYIAVLGARFVLLIGNGDARQTPGVVYTICFTASFCLLLLRRRSELREITRIMSPSDGGSP
jgi:hypothetical protein